MAIVISTTAVSVFMYGILKVTENFLKSKGIDLKEMFNGFE